MQRLGGAKAVADQILAAGRVVARQVLAELADAVRPLRPVLARTGRTIYAGVSRDGELGTLAVVSMLMFQLAVGTAGLLLISDHHSAQEPADLCRTGTCAVGTGAPEPLASATPTRRPLSGGLLLGLAGDSPAGGDSAAPSPTVDAAAAPATQKAPQAEGDPANEPEARENDRSDELALSATVVAQALFDVVELPTPTEVFDLPLDPTVRDLPTRRMPYEEFAEHGPEMIERLPSLDVLHAHFPENPMTNDVEAQKEHILYLAEQVEVSVEGYHRLAVDMTRRTAFRSLPNYHDEIEPRMFVVHWTGIGYRNVDHFVKSMRPNRVQYFINRDAQVFELFESDTNWPAHALGANDFAQGVEIETGHFDEKTSPLFSYTPAQIEHTIYVAVDFLRRNGLPVDETTLVGHYAADLLFTNPYYDPHAGRFTQDRIRKFDPPQELMQVIVHKAQQLDAALDAT